MFAIPGDSNGWRACGVHRDLLEKLLDQDVAVDNVLVLDPRGRRNAIRRPDNAWISGGAYAPSVTRRWLCASVWVAPPIHIVTLPR